MASVTPGRPTRRAAARKQTIIESDSDDKEETVSPPEATQRSTRKPRSSSRAALTTNEAMASPAPARNSRKRRTSSMDPPEPSESQTHAKPPARKGRRKRVQSQMQQTIEEEIQLNRPDKTPVPTRADHTSAQEASTTTRTTPPQNLGGFSGDSTGYSPDSHRRTVLNIREGVNSPDGRPRKFMRKSLSPTPGAPAVPRSPNYERLPTPAPAHSLNSPVQPLQLKQTEQLPQKLENDPPSQVPLASQLPQVETATQLKPQPASQQPPQSTEPKPRMVIRKLVLMNFKSYAGRQEVGPFHHSFSSVVGPNGSGKSNVIDSLLFVFGFRASKMRQGKISALIHNSANYPDLSYCEVEVHFQEVLDSLNGVAKIIEGSDLIVSRKAFKNNSSKYTINNKESNFTQVTALLRERGIDLDHKRFLILQGEVESIAQMKPKAQGNDEDGLLEYLEDIIGTSKYKQPIEESAQEMEALNEVCVEKNARVQHVEKEKNSLEDKKNTALTFIKHENELAIKHAALYQIYIQDCRVNANATSELITQLQAELDEEMEKRKDDEEGITNLERKVKKEAAVTESIERQVQAISKEMAKYDKESVKLEEKKKFLAGKEKKLNKSLQTNRHLFTEAEGLIKKHESDIERLAGEITTLETKLKVEEQELGRLRDELKDKTQVFSDQITLKQKSLEPWSEKINLKQSARAVAQSELDILNEKKNASLVEYDEIQTRITKITEDRVTKEAELKDCRKEKAQVEKELQKLAIEIQRMKSKEQSMRDSLSAARDRADEASASLQKSQNESSVLQSLMRLQESGRVEGVYGRLGNLGSIDGKYDVAISTACGGLDNIVVADVNVAQQCLDYLRKNNLGRATLIPLDKLPTRNLSKPKTPEGVPRLFDLINIRDQMFSQAFYSVLGDTLVANDLAQANRIAYGEKRHRVVTLDGKLIETSGVMSGGGNRVTRGKMSDKIVAEITSDVVGKLEQERNAKEKEYIEFQDALRNFQERHRELTNRLPEIEITMTKINLEIESGAKHITDAEKRMQELRELRPSTADNSNIAAIEKKIGGLDREIEQLRDETSGIEEEIKALQDKIMEIGGVRLRSQNAKVDGLKERIELLNDQQMQADVARTKAQKNRAKAQKAIAEGEQDLESVMAEVEAVEGDIKSQAQAAAEVKAREEEGEEFLQSKREELATLKEELDEKKEEYNKTRAAEIEIKQKLESNQKLLQENTARAKHWQEKLNKLNLHNLKDLGAGAEEEDISLPECTEDELKGMSKEALKTEIALLEEKTQDVNIDLSVLSEYRRRLEEYTARNQDLQAAVANRDEVKRRCDDFRKRRLEEFMEGFQVISLRLKEMYQMITMGGNAELELVDSLDPFSEGILFSVMPPKKSWKNISNLSGGEKTLSSLALVFALHHYKPTPLYVMDEIDAALDFRNVSIVANYIKERTKNAQFIVISLRNNMFELASRLVGVYKVSHMTKSITLENRDYAKGLHQKQQQPKIPQIPATQAAQA